jgi:hypothetical protein
MRKYVFVTAALALSGGPALGYLGSVITSYPAPSASPVAIAKPNAFLNVFCDSGRGMIYRLNSLSGSVEGSFGAVAGTQCRGLAYSTDSHGNHLWQGKISYPYMVFDTYVLTGSIYRSWPLNNTYERGLAPFCTGDGGSGTTRLFTCDYNAHRIYERRLDTGSIYHSVVFPANVQMYDIAWDWRNRLLWGGMNSPYIYGINRLGSLVASFPSPAGLPYGIAYGSYMLYIGTCSDHRIWRVHCPDTIGVEPASIGRTKAALR